MPTRTGTDRPAGRLSEAMPAPPTSASGGLRRWVEGWAGVLAPEQVHWCDGSVAEYDRLCQQLVDTGTFERLDGKARPASFLARSDPADVARVEDRTFICSAQEDDAGPTNNWRDPEEMRSTMHRFYAGAMRGLSLIHI